MYHDDDGIVEFWENQRYWGLTWGTPLLPFDWPAFSDAQGNTVQLSRPPEREGERGWFVVRTLGTDEGGWRYSTVFSKLTTPRPGGRASKRSSDYVRSRVWRKLSVQPEPPDRELHELFYPSRGANAHAAGVGNSAGTSGRSGAAIGLPPLATSGAAGAAAAAASAAATAAAATAAEPSRPPPPRLEPEAERILLSAVAAAGISASGARGNGGGGALPKPSLFKLWQIFLELWNDACARHGMRRLVPLDPLGLYVASRRHRGLLSRQQRSQLAAGRLVAAVPLSTEVEPDVLDAQQDAAAQEAAAEAAGAAGAGSQQAAEAAVAAATAAAAAMAHQHLSPTVGETPTGAAITQPAAPEPATLHRGGGGAGPTITGPPGSVTDGSAADGGDTVLSPNQGLVPDLSDPETLLGELMVATNYARAAYGYPMAAGHLGSLAKLITMFGSSAHFNPITGASAEANLEAIHLFTGIPVEDVVMAEWRSSVFRPCHYLAVDRRRRRLVLAVRGSLELADIATDLTARPMEFDFGEGLVGHVHQGLMSAASYVQLNTAAALRSAAERFPGWPLLVTGHSLGAGVAALLTLLLRQRGRPMCAPAAVPVVHCLAIAPPAVLSASLAEAARGCVASVVLGGDFVARLSCYSVDRALLELVQASPAAQMADNLLQSTGATWAAIQQRLAALGSAATGGGGRGEGSGSSGSSGGGGGGPFGFLAGSGRGGNGEQQRCRGMEVELVPTCGGLKDIPLLTGAAPAPGLAPAPAGAAGAQAGEPPSPQLRRVVPHQRYHYQHTHLQQQHQQPPGGQPGPQGDGEQPHLHGHAHSHHHQHHHHHHHQQHQHTLRHLVLTGRRSGVEATESPSHSARSSGQRRSQHPWPPDPTAQRGAEDDAEDAVTARSDSGGTDVDDDASYFTAASPRESFMSAASSPASRAGGGSSSSVPLEDALESAFLYRASHPPEHHAAAAGAAPGGALPSHASSPRHAIPGQSSAAMAAAAAAAAVGGVPYAVPHGSAGHGHRLATSARAIPAQVRHWAGAGGNVPDAVDERFAAVTPPLVSPDGGTGSLMAAAAAAESWGLGFGSGGTPPAGSVAAAPEVPPLGLRRSSDPLASRGALYRAAEADEERAAGMRRGGRARRRVRSRSRGASGGEGSSGGGGNGDSLISWEALSQKLMTSWFGKGFLEDEEDEEDEEAGRASSDEGNNGGGGFGWWLAAMTNAAGLTGSAAPSAAAGASLAGRGAQGGNGSAGGGLTSCWPGLEEPPGPHRHPDAAGSALRGKYGAPSFASMPWPWPDQPQPPEQRPPPQTQAPAGPKAAPPARQQAGGAGGAGSSGQKPRHRPCRSAPAEEMPDVSDALGSDADEEPPSRHHRHLQSHALNIGPDGAATANAASGSGGEAGASGGAAAAEPHYLHSVHKELYPPGRLLWMVVDEIDALPEHLRQAVLRAATTHGSSGDGGADGGLGAAVPTEDANGGSTATAGSTEAVEGQEGGDVAHGEAQQAGKKSESYGLLDLSLVTDLVHGLVVGPNKSAEEPAATGGREDDAAAAVGAITAAKAPAQLQVSHAAAAAGASAVVDAAAVAAEASAQGGASGKRPRVSFCGEAWTDVAAEEEALPAAAQGMQSPFRAASGGRTAPSSPPLASADAAGSTPFTARVREGLKRIKSGVETMLRQAPIPSVPSVAFLPGVAAAAAAAAAVLEDVTAPASDAAERAAEASTGGAAQPPSGPWVFLVEAEREVFERMVLIPNCFTDHLPDAYVQRLRQLAKGAVLPGAVIAGEGAAGRVGGEGMAGAGVV